MKLKKGYLINIEKSYQKIKTILVKNGVLSVELDGARFITLFAK